MWAIFFKLSNVVLEKECPNISLRKAYAEIRKFLEKHGFYKIQKTLYFGNEAITEIKCILVIQKLGDNIPWFFKSVETINIWKIERNINLATFFKQ